MVENTTPLGTALAEPNVPVVGKNIQISPVAEQLDQLDNAIEDLASEIKILEDRLRPVLEDMPVREPGVDGSEAVSRGSSNVIHRVRESVRKVQILAYFTRSMRSRAEV